MQKKYAKPKEVSRKTKIITKCRQPGEDENSVSGDGVGMGTKYFTMPSSNSKGV